MLILKIDRRITKDEFWDIFNKWVDEIPRRVVNHLTRRITKPKQTPEERKQKRKEFYEKNKQKILDYQKEYHLKNRDERLPKMRENAKKKRKDI